MSRPVRVTNRLDANHVHLNVQSKGRVAVLPVAGLPGKPGQDGQDGAKGDPGDSVIEDPPVNLTTLFENALV